MMDVDAVTHLIVNTALMGDTNALGVALNCIDLGSWSVVGKSQRAMPTGSPYLANARGLDCGCKYSE